MTDAPPAPTIVLTGGSGFIGRAVIGALRARGHRVVVVDRDPLRGRFADDPAVSALIGDLHDPGLLAAAIRPGVTAVVHLAAITSVLGSVDQPMETFRLNVEVTQHLLDLSRRHGVGRFVLASTNAVVGDVGGAVIDVDMPLNPLTPYGATKAAAEMLALGYAGSYGLGVSVLRLTNVYGPGMEAKDSFVPRMMRAALTGRPVQVYGTGEQIRDLVNVADVAHAVTLALDSTHTGRAIIGSGRSISVLEMVDRVRTATGVDLVVEHVDAPKGEMPAVRVDISASERLLGYRPQVDLDTGLVEVWDDFRSAAETG